MTVPPEVTANSHHCRLAATYATVDATTYCDHPSHWGPPYPEYCEFAGCVICGNCGIPVSRHGERCGDYLLPGDQTMIGWPWRDPAARIELGERVCRELMSRADWKLMLRIGTGQRDLLRGDQP